MGVLLVCNLFLALDQPLLFGVWQVQPWTLNKLYNADGKNVMCNQYFLVPETFQTFELK